MTNPAVERLAAFVGEWSMAAAFPSAPSAGMALSGVIHIPWMDTIVACRLLTRSWPW